MRYLTFFILIIAFLFVGCSKNNESNSPLNAITLKLKNNLSFQALVSFKTALKQKKQDFDLRASNNNKKEITFQNFIAELGFNNIEDYRQYIFENHLPLINKMIREIPELSQLTSQEFETVWNEAKKITVFDRATPWVKCMTAAWNTYDLHTDECIHEYTQTGNGTLYGDCLDSALNNYIFETDLC